MPVFDKKTLFRILLCVSGCIVVYWLLNETERFVAIFRTVSDVFAPFVFGGVLAFILNVPMRAIENGLFRKINKLLLIALECPLLLMATL